VHDGHRYYFGIIGAERPPGTPPLDPAFAPPSAGFWTRARQVMLPIVSIGAAVWIGSKIVQRYEKAMR